MYEAVRGGKYFVDGDLDFGHDFDPFEKRDGTYRTVFGPSVGHNGIIYRDSDFSMRSALRRLTGCRVDVETDLKLEQAQTNFLCLNGPEVLSYFHSLDFDFQLPSEEAQLHRSDPHPKKDLREQAFDELCLTGDVFLPVWMRANPKGEKIVLYKAKKNEYAKPGKYMRAIGDLGVSASLEGAWLTKYMKTAVARKAYTTVDFSLKFVMKPDHSELQYVFDQLINPDHRVFFVYHSDDACVAIRVGGVVYRFNLDISSCDASHSPALFNQLKKTANKHEPTMTRLVEQCQLPCEIRSRQRKKNGRVKKLVLKTKDGRARLYSGSTLTTLLNGLANLNIGLSITQATIPDGATMAQVAVILKEAAARVGYIITVQCCEIVEDLQFLKHSPTLTSEGEYAPMLNLGVLLRASGVCKGDLPGRGDLARRGKFFQAALINGAYPRSHSTFIDTMRHQAGPLNPNITTDQFSYKVTQTDHHTFVDSSIYRRYRLSTEQVSQLLVFASSGFGYQTANPGLSSVLNVDYGLECINRYPLTIQDPRLKP